MTGERDNKFTAAGPGDLILGSGSGTGRGRVAVKVGEGDGTRPDGLVPGGWLSCVRWQVGCVSDVSRLMLGDLSRSKFW